MKRVNRVLKNSEFKTIISTGKKINATTFTIFFAKSEFLKVGIVVSKKAYPLAVDRNKVKRQVRDIISKNVTNERPYKFIIIVKKGFLEKPFIVNTKNLIDKINSIG